MISLICEIFKKKKIRLVKYRQQTGSCKRSGWRGRGEWVGEMGKGVKRYKLPGIK